MGRVCHAYFILFTLRQCKESWDIVIDEGVYEVIVDGMVRKIEKADVDESMPELNKKSRPVGSAKAVVEDWYGVKVDHIRDVMNCDSGNLTCADSLSLYQTLLPSRLPVLPHWLSYSSTPTTQMDVLKSLIQPLVGGAGTSSVVDGMKLVMLGGTVETARRVSSSAWYALHLYNSPLLPSSTGLTS